MVIELLGNMLQSTVAGFFGVIGIFTYLGAIVIAALYRIHEGMNEHH